MKYTLKDIWEYLVERDAEDISRTDAYQKTKERLREKIDEEYRNQRAGSEAPAREP